MIRKNSSLRKSLVVVDLSVISMAERCESCSSRSRIDVSELDDNVNGQVRSFVILFDSSLSSIHFLERTREYKGGNEMATVARPLKNLQGIQLCGTNALPCRIQAIRTLLIQSASESVKLNKLTDSDSGIVEVSLDRPESKNSIGKDMLRGLQAAFETVNEDHKARLLMICSSVPKVFCAGADLKERRKMSPLEIQDYVRSLRSTFSSLEALHVPSIAVIEGVALGGGLEMALACDLRICGEDAVLGLPETGLAIIPGAGGTQRLPRLVGKSVAKEMIFTGKKVQGRDALSMGLVNHCVPSGEARSKALELARDILQKGPIAIRMAKRAIDDGLESDIAYGLSVEDDCYAQVLRTKDRLEGLAAFAERRKPNYIGE